GGHRRKEVREAAASVAVRLAVTAVVAADGRLDEARAIAVAALRKGQPSMAGVHTDVDFGLERVRQRHPAREDVADDRAQLLVVPQISAGPSTCTSSMMPTIAASTGAALRPSASPAARPSSTMSTFSDTPAPTPSTASSADPRGASSRP